MKPQRVAVVAGIMLVICVIAYIGWFASRPAAGPLRVAISPYQDLAMLTTHEHLGLEDKYNVDIELLTYAWEEVIPALASAGPTFDVGFGSLIEFLTKYEALNSDTDDPLVYVFPAYVFKGGGFVTFNPEVPEITGESSKEQISKFLSYRIGAQKHSMFDMMLFTLARDAGLNPATLSITDTTMADGLLAAAAGSLDLAAAGLTQRNEALERGGRVALSMDALGFADLTGLICKKSTLVARRDDIEKLVRIWFDCVAFVYEDLDTHSAIPLRYLKTQSSTQYTVASYKRALEAEYLPTTVEEATRQLVADDGQFSLGRISDDVASYLTTMKIAKARPPIPDPIVLENK